MWRAKKMNRQLLWRSEVFTLLKRHWISVLQSLKRRSWHSLGGIDCSIVWKDSLQNTMKMQIFKRMKKLRRRWLKRLKRSSRRNRRVKFRLRSKRLRLCFFRIFCTKVCRISSSISSPKPFWRFWRVT